MESIKGISELNKNTIDLVENGKSPEEVERIRRIVEIFSVGLDSNDIVGYHGTSLESVEYLIKNGTLPGSTGDSLEETDHPSQSIYFYPLQSHLGEDYIDDDGEAIDAASGYANDIAQTHYFLKVLGFDLANRQISNLARILVLDSKSTPEGEEAYEFFLKNDIPASSIDQAIKDALMRKGVVLGLGMASLKKYRIGPGDKDERDLSLQVPEGLHYDVLAGLEPLGQVEWDYFTNLQKNNLLSK